MTKPSLSYVVCTVPRTGSSLLCATLSNTHVAGYPAEYFDVHRHNDLHWRKTLSITGDREYLARVIDAGTTANGVFGCKLHWHQMPAMQQKFIHERGGEAKISASDVGSMGRLIQDRLGDVRYIWLRRKNRVAQAISYYRAAKTDVWRIPTEGRGAEISTAVTPDYSYDAIAENIRFFEQADRNWYRFFIVNRLSALVVVYEDMIADYDLTVRGVLSHVGVNLGEIIIPARSYQKQADAVSSDWEKVFREATKPAGLAQKYPYTPSRVIRRRRQSRPAPGEPLPLIAYDVQGGINFDIVPAPATRPWMTAIPSRFAYRCLPLSVANQAGWLIRNSHKFTAIWDGKPGIESLRVTYAEAPPVSFASSHFGHGILTFAIGRLFRTPPGFNLLVRGPANMPKDGVTALEGIVESDWSHATFTMNWQVTRPDYPVTFAADEPIAMIVPVRRGEIERFSPETRDIGTAPDWEAGHREWARSRFAFNAALRAGDPKTRAAGWQRHYTLGLNVAETEAPEHQTSLSLSPFVDRRSNS